MKTKPSSKSQPKPALTQYREAKAAAPDAIVLIRMGDFYEAFGDDARTLARTLGLAVTTRDKHSADALPMVGFPYHQLEAYLGKLVACGFRVAIVEPAS